MARRKMAWKELRVGILAILSFLILAIALVLVSGGRGFLTQQYTLKTYLQSASGLRKGSLVWLAGIEVGNVHQVNISGSENPDRAAEIIMRIEKQYQEFIREDSAATLGSIGLLGDKYVDISRGSLSHPILPENGEVIGSTEADIKKIMQNSNDLVANLGDLVDKISEITSKVNVGQGTLGKLINDPSMFNSLSGTSSELHSLVTEVKSGEGSIGRLIAEREVYDNLKQTLGRMDDVMAKVNTGEGTLGKFVNDPSLYNRADSVMAKFETVAQRLEKGEGFLGRLSKDESLYLEFRESMNKFSSVAEQMNKGDGTIARLLKDPSLYSNLNEASAEVVKLMYDFRKNPKRFLRIKFGLF